MYTHAYCPNCKKKRPIRTMKCKVEKEDLKETLLNAMGLNFVETYTELVCNHCHTVIATVYSDAPYEKTDGE